MISGRKPTPVPAAPAKAAPAKSARKRAFVVIGMVVALLGAGVTLFLMTNHSGGLDGYEQAAKLRWAQARQTEAPAQAFRATICASQPCVLVEVSGLSFVVGAGQGAAEGLRRGGLLRRDMDGVLLQDLGFQSIAGLAAVGEAVVAAGRADALTVYGPEGVFAVVDGTNLMLSGGEAGRLRLAVGDEGEDQGLSGKVVYDSGVVTVLAFPASRGGRVLRIDAPQRSLVLAGCTASPADVVAASRGAREVTGIIAAGSERLLEIDRKAARAAGAPVLPEMGCMTDAEAVQAIQAARMSAALIVPLAPDPGDSAEAWKASATIPKGPVMDIAEPGTVLDLSGKTPEIARR